MDKAFGDLALVLQGQFGPAVVKGVGFVQDFVLGQPVYLEEINLGLELRKLGCELV